MKISQNFVAFSEYMNFNKFKRSTNQPVLNCSWKHLRLSPLGTNLGWIYTYLDFHNVNKVCWPNVVFFVQSGHFGQVGWFVLKLFCGLFSPKSQCWYFDKILRKQLKHFRKNITFVFKSRVLHVWSGDNLSYFQILVVQVDSLTP